MERTISIRSTGRDKLGLTPSNTILFLSTRLKTRVSLNHTAYSAFVGPDRTKSTAVHTVQGRADRKIDNFNCDNVS